MVSKRISFDDGLESVISILTGGFTSILPAKNHIGGPTLWGFDQRGSLLQVHMVSDYFGLGRLASLLLDVVGELQSRT